jgi:hypothetical protein
MTTPLRRKIFRFRYETIGYRTFVEAFAGDDGQAALRPCGTLTFDPDEFLMFKLILENAPPMTCSPTISFIPRFEDQEPVVSFHISATSAPKDLADRVSGLVKKMFERGGGHRR